MKAYKICANIDGSLMSSNARLNLGSFNKLAPKNMSLCLYGVGKKTVPHQGSGPLLAIDTIDNANFALMMLGGLYELELYECEVVPCETTEVWMSTCTADDDMISVRTPLDRLQRLFRGTIACDEITLTGRVA